MPKVSVCIPTYNRANFLLYSVNSVLAQTYQNFEILICDDGSTDNTSEVVQQWNDSRIRYIRQAVNGGRSRNMRSGFEAATGDYFIKFDDDDALTPKFLEKTVAVLDAESNIDFVCTNHWIINQQNERVESATKENSAKWGKDKLQGLVPDLVRETFVKQSLQVGSTLFRRSALQEVNFMRPEADGCEDFDLLVRLALANKQGYFLSEYLMEYRIHGGQTSLKQNLHFLRAKLFCMESYKFSNEELEKIRLHKLAHLQQSLGLRLIENGDTMEGRKFLQESSKSLGFSSKVMIGILWSYFPKGLQQFAIEKFRNIRPKNYSERVREGT
ncbi:MAG: glycosyltransferase [Scytonematopsis contorta HA4267-MV1]|jgi:glycosyltransferase involved in cell wall biosynthesis|nr:glycosyltransferase [Scytonematopsis contorta HA4267-MV1]